MSSECTLGSNIHLMIWLPSIKAPSATLHHITKNAAMELGLVGIGVNCISPSIVVTDLSKTEFKTDTNDELEERFASKVMLKGMKLKTQDIAESVLFLAGKESRYINIHNLVVDDGLARTNSLVSCHTYSCV